MMTVICRKKPENINKFRLIGFLDFKPNMERKKKRELLLIDYKGVRGREVFKMRFKF